MHIQEILNAIYANHTYEYIVIDENYRVIEFSDKAFALCKKSAKECDKIHLADVVPELYGVESILEKIFLGEKDTFTVPYILKEPDTYVHIHVHPGREKESADDAGKSYESLIILFENITDMAHTQQRLVQERNEKALLLEEISQKNAQLKRFNEEMQVLVDEEIKKNMEKQKMIELQARHAQMGEMIGMITHQWKQPLNVISLVVNVLKLNRKKQSLSDKEIDKKLDDILKQVCFMDQTVSDFQNFFNPSKERIYFNLYDNVKSIIDLVQFVYSHHNITIELHGDRKLLAYGYPNEFNQVLLTLMNNAKDAYRENPQNDMRIFVDISERDGKPCVTVRDTAGGIKEEVMNKIFDLYVTTKDHGSGIGLNLAKNMVENNMEGELLARNVDGGAEFTVILPAASAG
jgi:nitrogen fixation/metabolism regulation signal transduction histidine kinase